MEYWTIILFAMVTHINAQPGFYNQNPPIPFPAMRRSMQTTVQSSGGQSFETSVVPDENLLQPILRRAINIAMSDILNNNYYHQNHYQNNIGSNFYGSGPGQSVYHGGSPTDRRTVYQNNAQTNDGGMFYGSGPSQIINTNDLSTNDGFGTMHQNNNQVKCLLI